MIPAGALAVLGAAQLAGPDVRRMMRTVQDFWPWALLAAVAWLLLTRSRR